MVWLRTGAGLQTGIEIAVVAGIHAGHKILGGVGEELEASAGRVEAEKPQRGGGLAAGRNIDREAFHGRAPLPGTQVGQPNESEREDGGGVSVSRTGDSGPRLMAVAQAGA